MENKKYSFKLYEKGRQYNDSVIYPLSRGYNHSLPPGFFSSYSTIGITCTNGYKRSC